MRLEETVNHNSGCYFWNAVIEVTLNLQYILCLSLNKNLAINLYLYLQIYLWEALLRSFMFMSQHFGVLWWLMSSILMYIEHSNTNTL